MDNILFHLLTKGKEHRQTS